jgi:MFS transporter, OFA family, oxalate/formate antiporter
MLVEGIFTFITGGLSDKYGPRIVITISAFLLGAGYCLIYLVNSLWQFYLFYGVIVGISMGAMFVPLVALLARWFKTKRTMVNGIVMCGSSIGVLIMAPLATQLISIHGWRTTFLFIGIGILVIILTAVQFIKRDPSTIGLLAYGEDTIPQRDDIKAAHSFSMIKALQTRQFWIVFTVLFLFGFYVGSINIHIIPDAIHLGISATIASGILAVSAGAGTFGRIGLGFAGDKIGNKKIFIFGFIVYAALIVWITQLSSIWAFFIFAAFYGISQGGLLTSQGPLVASLFGLKSLGMVFGSVSFGITLGMAVGPYLTGFMIDLTGSYNTAFLFCLGGSLIALILTFLIKPASK